MLDVRTSVVIQLQKSDKHQQRKSREAYISLPEMWKVSRKNSSVIPKKQINYEYVREYNGTLPR